MTHVSSSERSKVFQALLFSKEVSHVRCHFQGRVIKIVFYVEMFQKRNRPNLLLKLIYVQYFGVLYIPAIAYPMGYLFCSCYWSPVRGLFQTQSRSGLGRSEIKQWRERFQCYVCILQESFLTEYLFCMRKLPIILLC